MEGDGGAAGEGEDLEGEEVEGCFFGDPGAEGGGEVGCWHEDGLGVGNEGEFEGEHGREGEEAPLEDVRE